MPRVLRSDLFALLAGCKVGRLQLQHRQHRRTVRVSASTPPAGIADTNATATMSQLRKVVSRDDANLAMKVRDATVNGFAHHVRLASMGKAVVSGLFRSRLPAVKRRSYYNFA